MIKDVLLKGDLLKEGSGQGELTMVYWMVELCGLKNDVKKEYL